MDNIYGPEVTTKITSVEILEMVFLLLKKAIEAFRDLLVMTDSLTTELGFESRKINHLAQVLQIVANR